MWFQKTRTNTEEKSFSLEKFSDNLIADQHQIKLLEVKIDDCMTKIKKLNLKFNAFLREEAEEEIVEKSIKTENVLNVDNGRSNPFGSTE